MTAAPRTGPRMARPGSATEVEAELDHPRRDQPRALAPGFAGNVEFDPERVETALRGALADVQLLGDLRPGRGPAGEGALAAVGGDERSSRRPLLICQPHGRLAGGRRRPRPAG